MKRTDAIPYIGHYVDDAQSSETFEIDQETTLVGWQCGFEPMFVAVKSYIDGVIINEDDAAEIATELLTELKWFSEEPTEPDYILIGTKK
jgi:hypothetical protein